jgi:hypothetical protein
VNLDIYNDAVGHARLHFEEGLIRAGFRESDNGWIGMAGPSGTETEVRVALPERFPFKPPKVWPTVEASVPWSWHREINGSLCLVAEDDYEGLWWTDAPAFLHHVTKWLECAAAGWPDDRPGPRPRPVF